MQFLARSISKSVRPLLNSRARQSWVLSQQCYSTSSRTWGGVSRASKSESATPVSAGWDRPTEIPYQPKIANSIDLIGYVSQPVQFHVNHDESIWASTIISHRPSSESDSDSDSDSNHKFWIPILFRGILAHTATCHLKKNDCVHITGQVFVDASPSGEKEYVQVMVHDLHYIEGSKTLPKVSPTLDRKGVLKHSANVQKGSGNVGTDCWFDLLDKPEEWFDYRESKQNGSVKPKHPDFKKKDGTVGLWLNSAPKEILSDLKDAKFDIPVRSKYAKQPKAGEESWKDLVENMNQWWDNRVDKRYPKSPDFKHKKTGVALWLSDSASWVTEKLPPPATKKQETF